MGQPLFDLISNIIKKRTWGFHVEMQREYSLEKNVSISSS